MTLPTSHTPGYGDFRGHTACTCLIAWLPVYEAALQREGLLDGPLTIYQLTGAAAASSSTHSQGGAFDLLDNSASPKDAQIVLARQMGADACWHRPPNWDGKNGMQHQHGVLRGCIHNVPARYQIVAVDAGFNGLGHLGQGAADDGPRPLSGRTWQQGIAWANEQEDEVTPEQIASIATAAVEAWANGKPTGSDLTRDQLLKQGTKAAQEARDAVVKK